MAIIDSIIKRKNASGTYDTIHPKTKAAQVEGLATQISTAIASLNNIGDVNTAGVTDGQTLVYDDATDTWIPGTASGGGDVSKEDLQNLYIYGKASVAITKGQALQFAGVQGDHILIKPAVPAEINVEPTLMVGIAETDAAINEFIYVLINGRLNLNTSTYTAGDLLYFASAGSIAGALTTTEPTDPNASIQLAVVSIDGVGNGEFLVRKTILTRHINEVLGLQGALDGKSATGHTHAISAITNLQTSLNAKQDDLGTGTTGQFLRWGALGVSYWDTVTASDVGASSSGHTHTFASLTSKPTTLSGYGITDAYSSSNPSGYQTAAQVATAVSGLVASAPATLDTLNELAVALGNDPNFATTVSTNIGTKVSKSGDTMTGTLTYTTLAGPGTSSRDKIRVYSSSTYAIGMQSGITYGGLNDWAMTFQFADEDDRGFWWGDTAHTTAQGAMSLTTNGRLTVAEGIKVGYSQTDTSIPDTGLQVNGNTNLGSSNGHTTRINDILYVEATDSGDSHFYFGENSSGSYGTHWYWDAGHTHYWYSRNAGTDTQLMRFVTNNTADYIYWNRPFHINNKSIDYVSQLHFNDNVRFYQDGNDSYLNFKFGDASAGGIKFRDGNDNLHGYIYGDGDTNFGILNSDGQWAVRATPTQTSLYHDGSERILTETDKMRIATPSGNVYIGAQNTSWAHFTTDRARFYFGSPMSINGGLQDYATGSNYWHASNDGSGSGLDADLLDGNHASAFYLASNPSGYITSTASISGGSQFLGTERGTPDNALQYWQASGLGTTEAPNGDWHNTIRMSHGDPLSYYSNTLAIRMTGVGVGDIYTQTIMNGSPQGWKKHWNDGNDGSGSGLSADNVDGYHIVVGSTGSDASTLYFTT
jgi:hypothetical protein